MWRALRAVAIGLGIGAILAGVAGQALLRTLPELEHAEAWTAGPAVVILAMVATLAAALPARRTVRLDPTTALRAE
jgi:ABC-type antimicrobial peptide transport system permease subunit